MKRRSTIFPILSLVTLAGLAALWVRSYAAPDEWYRVWYVAEPAIYGYDSIASRGGGLFVHFTRLQFSDPADLRKTRELQERGAYLGVWTYRRPMWPVVRSKRAWERLSGIEFEKTSPGTKGWGTTPPNGYTLRVRVPLWLPVCAAMIYPLRVLGQHVKQRKRRNSGRCVSCGYDIRATPQRCPECGTEAVVNGNI